MDSVRQKLEALACGETIDEKTKSDLKKRKLVNEITVKSLYVKRGPHFTTDIKKLEADLTPEMIASGSWKTTTFKKYNFNALGIQPACGHLHPLMKVRSFYCNDLVVKIIPARL
uniref:PheRS_DBD2 domain-containing protein n=1 Tax=Heterorhabditis bacteriophora TaxID=37862 RepID=A0A1I7XG12_HETBA